MECTFYQNMVKDAKAAYTAAGCPPLGPDPTCSTDFAVHLSFDYAQQVHLPSMAFVWRASPGRSTTSLMRATVAARVPMPSFPISTTALRTMGLGRMRSTCTVITAVARTRTGMSWPTSCGEFSQDVTIESISLNFLITGHTKFAPDWCFGLLKQKFRKEPVSSLKEIEARVCCSTLQEVNIPQLTGDERGTVFVPMYDWQAFLSKPVKGIKKYHHFSFSHQAQGVVMATTHAEGPTQIL